MMVALAQQPNMWHEPISVARGDIFQLGQHRLMCADSTNAEDVARLLEGNTCDLIFADPPYGIGIDDWDIAIEDVIGFIGLITSHLKPGGFFAFTHQMPYMVDWLYALKHSHLKHKDHIAWVKRVATTPGAALMRSHESLFIYSFDKAAYQNTKGLFSDVKVPGILFDLYEIGSIQKYISDLHLKAKEGKYEPRHERPVNKYKGYQATSLIQDLSPMQVNFTNVWSFLPENQKIHNGQRDKHTTAKPILLLERLLELCTPENALVYDAFLGSGTTLISAENTGRRCVGMELSPEYCASIIERWQEATGQRAERVEVAV